MPLTCKDCAPAATKPSSPAHPPLVTATTGPPHPPTAMKPTRILLLLTLMGAVVAFFVFDLGRYFSLTFVKDSQAQFAALYAERPWTVTAIYFAVYVVITALSLPGAAIMTLAGGASFGLVWGTVVVSFASTLGATLAMLAARYLFQDSIQQRFGRKLAEVNARLDKEGAFYLFTLRLLPVIPFFALNLLMGLTRMKAWTFSCVSQLGMFAGTVAYVNAGTQIAKIDSLRGILSPALLGSFVALGLLPLAVKKLLDMAQRRCAAGADLKMIQPVRNRADGVVEIDRVACGRTVALFERRGQHRDALFERGENIAAAARTRELVDLD